MRIRFNELLAERMPGVSPYAFALESDGRISLSTAHRLAAKNGRVARFEATTLDALCDLFGVGVADLLERDKAKR